MAQRERSDRLDRDSKRITVRVITTTAIARACRARARSEDDRALRLLNYTSVSRRYRRARKRGRGSSTIAILRYHSSVPRVFSDGVDRSESFLSLIALFVDRRKHIRLLCTSYSNSSLVSYFLGLIVNPIMPYS